MTFNKRRLIEAMKQNDTYDTLEFVICKSIPDCLDLCSRIKHNNGDFIRLKRVSFRHEERILADFARRISLAAKLVECAIVASDSNDVVSANEERVTIRLKNEAVFRFTYDERIDSYNSAISYDIDEVHISMHTDLADDLLEATYQAAEMINSVSKMIKCAGTNNAEVTDLVNVRLKELKHNSDHEPFYIGSVVKELADKYDKGDG